MQLSVIKHMQLQGDCHSKIFKPLFLPIKFEVGTELSGTNGNQLDKFVSDALRTVFDGFIHFIITNY